VKLEVVAPLCFDDPPSDGGCRERLRIAAEREMSRSALPIAAARVRLSLRAYVAPHHDLRLDQLALAAVDVLTGVAFENAGLVIGLLVTRMVLERDGEERIDVCVVLDAGADEAATGRARRAA